ncbi:MAG: hypothetical protein Unbinned200contig1000_64 [Prokaryotic dsDNA virus sp.]|jgi:hypothetical protein|nr:hypothetical protein [Flavobacteriaceae bacterium]QDP65324.1 MAG: hypothetical protein Unbinned200contig1000_64 [Prokaryotic dsDNA virus sp.]|tara:strand:+ start:6047 stop:6367 length:321 start_codon:yes stop_codon:yes gene_type:complete
MYGNYFYEYEDFLIYNDNDEEPNNVMLLITLVCTSPGDPGGSKFEAPEFYEPPSSPVWEVEKVKIILENAKPVELTEDQFADLFPEGQEILNAAIETASEYGEVET